jgi:hypothetical protein
MDRFSARQLLSTVIADFTVRSSYPVHLVVGENVDVGSKISGLADFLSGSDGSRLMIINAPNTESITLGMCFGWATSSDCPALLFVKQLDFLTLYIDDLLNTKNLLDTVESDYNINLFTFLVDNRREGPQSCFRDIKGLEALLGISFIPVTYVSDPIYLEKKIKETGLKVFVASQSNFNVLSPKDVRVERRRGSSNSFFGFEVYDPSFGSLEVANVIDRFA